MQAHLAEIYGAEVSRETISTITDRVLDGLAEWQSRPLDAVYAVLFLDALYVKIRDGQVANRPIYVALGVTADGERDILGLWAGEHGDGEGAKYWLRVPVYTAATEAEALDRFAGFAGTWEAGIRPSSSCGRVPGPSSPRSWPSTGRSAR